MDPIVRTIRLPGVYGPQLDTRMLIDAIAREPAVRGARVLELGTGTGAIAVAAARAGAASVTAVDVSRTALTNAWLNARAQRVRVRLRRGDLVAPVTGRQFDVVLSNPPFVPATDGAAPPRGRARAWDAGHDGRSVVDRICAEAPSVLAPGGLLMMVHTGLCAVEETMRLLAIGGVAAEVVDRRSQPFGPLLRARSALLEARGLTEPGQCVEEMVVVRGVRTEVVLNPPAVQDVA